MRMKYLGDRPGRAPLSFAMGAGVGLGTPAIAGEECCDSLAMEVDHDAVELPLVGRGRVGPGVWRSHWDGVGVCAIRCPCAGGRRRGYVHEYGGDV